MSSEEVQTDLDIWEVMFTIEGIELPDEVVVELSDEFRLFANIREESFKVLHGFIDNGVRTGVAVSVASSSVDEARRFGELKVQDFMQSYSLINGRARIVQPLGASMIHSAKPRVGTLPSELGPIKLVGGQPYSQDQLNLTLRQAWKLSLDISRLANQGFSCIRLAQDFLQTALYAERPDLKIVNLFISLEALYAATGYKLALRLACLLELESQKRFELSQFVKDMYKMRSKIVHASYSIQIEPNDVIRLIDLVRKSIFAHIKLAEKLASRTEVLRELDRRILG